MNEARANPSPVYSEDVQNMHSTRPILFDADKAFTLPDMIPSNSLSFTSQFDFQTEKAISQPTESRKDYQLSLDEDTSSSTTHLGDDDDDDTNLTRRVFEDELKVRSLGKALSSLSQELEQSPREPYSRSRYLSDDGSNSKNGGKIRKESGSELSLLNNPQRSQRLERLIAEKHATKQIMFGDDSQVRSMGEIQGHYAASLPTTPKQSSSKFAGDASRSDSPLRFLFRKAEKPSALSSAKHLGLARSFKKVISTKEDQDRENENDDWFSGSYVKESPSNRVY